MLARILAILRSAECAKCIGWLKFISSIVITLFLVLVLIFFSSIAETIKKNLNSSSNTKFYVLLALFMIFLIAYAACSFVLIIGTINVSFITTFFRANKLNFTFILAWSTQSFHISYRGCDFHNYTDLWIFQAVSQYILHNCTNSTAYISLFSHRSYTLVI